MKGIKAEILDEEFRDGLENLIANLGSSMDKREHAQFVNKKQLSLKGNEDELNALYRTEWVSGKIVDIIPEDMTREWRVFTGDIDPEIIKELVEAEQFYKLRDTFKEAHKWSRLYGSSFIVMDIDDGQTPDKPLNMNAIKVGGLRHIKAIDRHRIDVSEQQPITNPLDPDYGFPEYYRFVETTTKIHHSRMLRFDSVKLPFDEFRRNNYFSDSVLSRLYDPILNFTTTCNGAATMVYETNVDVIKVKGLMGYLQTAEGENLLRKRFALAKLLKSFNNLTLLDSEEDFDVKSNTFAGLKDLLYAQALFISGASDVPATRMLGSSASGLNATGEGDLKNYYDTVRSKQISDYQPKLSYFDRIMAKSLGMSDDIDLSFEFRSLFQVTPKEKAETELIQAQRDSIYLDRSIIKESTVAKELRQNKTYTNITDEDIEELELFEEEEPIDGGFDTNTEGTSIEQWEETEGGKEEKAEPSENSEES